MFRESLVQRLVNSLGDGFGLHVMRGLMWLVFGAGVVSLFAFSQFRGITDPDAMDKAQVAYQLTRTGEMRTACIRPLDAGLLRARPEAAAMTMPDVRNAPAYSWLLSRFFDGDTRYGFRAVDAEKKIMLPLGGLCTVLSGCLLYLLAARYFDPRIAAASTLVFLVSEPVLSDAVSGGARPLALLMVVSAFAAASFVSGGTGGRLAGGFAAAGLAGLCCGAAFLTAYSMAAVFVPVALLVGASAGRWRGTMLAVFSVALLVTVCPWLLRNHSLTGSLFGAAPLTALYDTLLYPGDTIDRDLAPNLRTSVLFPVIWNRFVSSIGLQVESHLRMAGTGLVACFFVVSLFFRHGEDRVHALKWSVALGVVSLAVAGAVHPVVVDSSHLLLPLVAALGIGFLMQSVEETLFVEETFKSVLVSAVIFLSALPTISCLLSGPREYAYPPVHPPFLRYVSDLMGPDEYVCSDIPWAAAWYGEQPSILLPRRVSDLSGLRASGYKIGALYLTQETGDRRYLSDFLSGAESTWLPLLERKIPPDLPYVHGLAFPDGTRDQLFLTDRIRWGRAADRPTGSDVTP